MSGPWAVTGATGQQGGAVARELLARGEAVRGLTRDPSSHAARALADAGAEVVAADLTDVASLRDAFDGAAGVYAMTTMAGPAGTEGEVRQGSAVGEAVSAVGVPRLVYSSVGGADRSTGIPHFESKWTIERRLRALGLPLTVIRPVFFMENLRGYFAPKVENGAVVLRAPLGPHVPLQLVAVDDIGRMGATALLEPERIPGGAVEFAGDVLTAVGIAEVEGALHGLPARFEELPVSMLPDDDQQRMFRWFRETPAYTADLALTARLLGGATSYADWAAAHPA